jgi:hypothetical protein
MRKKLGQMFMESKIVANNGCNRSSHGLLNVCRRKVRSETFLGDRSAEEQQSHWLRIRACWTKFGEIEDVAKDGIRHWLVEPAVMRARVQK